MNVREKTFDGVVALAIVKQQEFAVASSAIAERENEEVGAKKVKIPYRANRAVVFDSSLFHESDGFRFKPGYENRRVNVTMLYGT